MQRTRLIGIRDQVRKPAGGCVVAEVSGCVKADAPASCDEPHKAERVAAQPAMVASRRRS
jgi:hypothetical protein